MSNTLALLFCGATLALAGDSVSPEVQHITQAPVAARYEIVQGLTGWSNGRNVYSTLRLDRFTGKVAARVSSGNSYTWEEMDIPELPEIAAQEPRFQLTQREYRSDTLMLLDARTGQTWAWEIQRPGDGLSPRVWKVFAK